MSLLLGLVNFSVFGKEVQPLVRGSPYGGTEQRSRHFVYRTQWFTCPAIRQFTRKLNIGEGWHVMLLELVGVFPIWLHARSLISNHANLNLLAAN